MGTYSRRKRIWIGALLTVCAVGSTMAFQSTIDRSAINQSHPKPDFIQVGSVNGVAGYVLQEDYVNELGGNVPLYDVDGKTVIGSFYISAKNVEYPINNNGQTYGSAADAVSPEQEPELISAVGIDGTIGYVLKKDLEGEQPKSPEEALAMQKNRPEGGRDIPLYDVDGKTAIGVFHIG